jgi:hypothetical protein
MLLGCCDAWHIYLPAADNIVSYVHKYNIFIQDVVVEQLEEDAEPGRRRYRLKQARAATNSTVVIEVDFEGQVMEYVKCVQNMLQLQGAVIQEWFGFHGYEGVLKQMWRALLVHSKALSGEVIQSCVLPSIFMWC